MRTRLPLCSSRRPLSSPPATIFRGCGIRSSATPSLARLRGQLGEHHHAGRVVHVEAEHRVVAGRVEALRGVEAVDLDRVAGLVLRVGGVEGPGDLVGGGGLEGHAADAGAVEQLVLGLADVGEVELGADGDAVVLRAAVELVGVDRRAAGGVLVVEDRHPGAVGRRADQALEDHGRVGVELGRRAGHGFAPSGCGCDR